MPATVPKMAECQDGVSPTETYPIYPYQCWHLKYSIYEVSVNLTNTLWQTGSIACSDFLSYLENQFCYMSY
jgi:hypothetical protein